MAAGRPIVSTRVSGAEEALVAGAAAPGGVVVERDATALASAIGPLLDDPGRRATIGAAARARFSAEFAYERMVERWDALLTDALTSSRRAGRRGAAASSRD
jgi:glycosyltransferase involved in cell wall biosynthesis